MAIRMLAVLLLLCSLTGAAVASPIPAIVMAGGGQSLPSPSPKTAEEAAKWLNSLQCPILLVTVPQLSLSDFSRYADVYGDKEVTKSNAFANIQRLAGSLGASHLLLNADGDSTDSLAGRIKALRQKQLESVDSSKQLPAGSIVGQRLLVSQVDVSSLGAGADSSEQQLLTEADKRFGELADSLLKKAVPFVAIFTGESEAPAASQLQRAAGRHLLAAAGPTAAPNATGTLVNCTGEVLLYYAQLQVSQVGSKDKKIKFKVNMPAVKSGDAILDKSSKCKGENKTLNLEWKSGASPVQSVILKMSMGFADKSNFWQVTGAKLTVKCSSSSNCTAVTDAPLTAKSMAALMSPNKTCYHCTDGAVLASAGNASVITNLRFVKLQFQPFGVKLGKFSNNVNDCVGFFSVQVWFTLFVLLVVTIILMYGVLMLCSVATPDRFDDPKGKTIQVNVQEG